MDFDREQVQLPGNHWLDAMVPVSELYGTGIATAGHTLMRALANTEIRPDELILLIINKDVTEVGIIIATRAELSNGTAHSDRPEGTERVPGTPDREGPHQRDRNLANTFGNRRLYVEQKQR